MRSSLDIAVKALEAITDPKQTSMRKRDANWARYIASRALDEIAEHGVPNVPTLGGVRWGDRQRPARASRR